LWHATRRMGRRRRRVRIPLKFVRETTLSDTRDIKDNSSRDRLRGAADGTLRLIWE
jgi:hypothetical protein